MPPSSTTTTEFRERIEYWTNNKSHIWPSAPAAVQQRTEYFHVHWLAFCLAHAYATHPCAHTYPCRLSTRLCKSSTRWRALAWSTCSGKRLRPSLRHNCVAFAFWHFWNVLNFCAGSKIMLQIRGAICNLGFEDTFSHVRSKLRGVIAHLEQTLNAWITGRLSLKFFFW